MERAKLLSTVKEDRLLWIYDKIQKKFNLDQIKNGAAI